MLLHVANLAIDLKVIILGLNGMRTKTSLLKQEKMLLWNGWNLTIQQKNHRGFVTAKGKITPLKYSFSYIKTNDVRNLF